MIYLVYAGNVREAECWAHLNPGRRARYVEDPNEVLDYDSETGTLVIFGTGNERSGRIAAQSVALCLGMRVIE
jgi:hypothetical protein